MSQQIRLGDLLGSELESDFSDFNLTEIKNVEKALNSTSAIDLVHAELLQQQALRGADLLIEYMAKMVKTVSYLESKVLSTKNKVSLEYLAPNGGKTTLDMKKWAAEVSPEVDLMQAKLAGAKGSKLYLDKKYDIMIKAHHLYKDIAAGLRRTILGYNANTQQENIPEGYE